MNKIFVFILVVLVFLLACLVLFQLLNQRNEIKTQYILDKEEQKKKETPICHRGVFIFRQNHRIQKYCHTNRKTIQTIIHLSNDYSKQ